MRKYNLIIIVIICSVFLTLSACKNNDSFSNDAYITINLKTSDSRSAKPLFNKKNFTDFKLNACLTINSGNEINLGFWSTYDEFINSKSKIETGLYNFSLTASCFGVKYKGVLKNVNIEAGIQELIFELEVQSYPEFTEENAISALKYSFNWCDDYYLIKEAWVYWDFYSNFEMTGTYANKEQLVISSEENGGLQCSVQFSKQNIDCFIARDSDIVLQIVLFTEKTIDGISYSNSYKKSFTDIVKLLPGITTETKKTLELPKNICSINYHFNVTDENLLLDTEKLTYTYIEDCNSVVIENPDHQVYKFKGWYDNPECTGEQITLIENTKNTKVIDLYASWSPLLGTTYNSQTIIPEYSVIFSDGTYSTKEELNKFSQNKLNVAVTKALGIVYDTERRMMVAVENGDKEVQLNDKGWPDRYQPYAARMASEGYIKNDVSGWSVPNGDDTYKILEKRDLYNEVLNLVNGTPIGNGYYTNEYKTFSNSKQQLNLGSGRVYTARILGVLYIDDVLTKSGMTPATEATTNGYWLKYENSSDDVFTYSPGKYKLLSWLAVKQY